MLTNCAVSRLSDVGSLQFHESFVDGARKSNVFARTNLLLDVLARALLTRVWLQRDCCLTNGTRALAFLVSQLSRAGDKSAKS